MRDDNYYFFNVRMRRRGLMWGKKEKWNSLIHLMGLSTRTTKMESLACCHYAASSILWWNWPNIWARTKALGGGVFWGAVSEPGRRGVCAMSPRDAVPTILSKTEYLEDGCMHPGCRQLTAKDHLIIYSSYFRLEVDNMCMSPTQCSY